MEDAYPGDIFRDKQGTIYRVMAICYEPTVSLVPLIDYNDAKFMQRIMTGGVSGLMWDGFERIYKRPREADPQAGDT